MEQDQLRDWLVRGKGFRRTMVQNGIDRILKSQETGGGASGQSAGAGGKNSRSTRNLDSFFMGSWLSSSGGSKSPKTNI